jgi:hypothetical protein
MPKDYLGREVDELRWRVTRMPVTGEWTVQHDSDNEFLMHGSKVVFFPTADQAVETVKILNVRGIDPQNEYICTCGRRREPKRGEPQF